MTGTSRRRSSLALFLLHALYDGLFLLFLLLSLPWFVLRAVKDKGLRESVAGRFGFGPRRTGSGPCVWVHGVSVGELKAARLFIEGIERRRPATEVIVSSTTTTGFRLAKRQHPGHIVVQFPVDLRWVIRRLFDRVRPDLIVLVELEIWPNLLAESVRRKIPVVIVNGRISARSFNGYRLLSRLLPQFELIRLYAVQNDEYAQRLRVLGVPDDQIRVTGNMKYDTLHTTVPPAQLVQGRRDGGLAADARVVVAGSTHAGEEELVLAALPALEAAVPGARLVLAPRHVERVADVVRAVEKAGRAAARLTRLRAGGATAPGAVLVVDTIGELEVFYGLADVVFVGGSLVPRGGHNILEPAALGKPTLFGPHTENFAEEVRLLKAAGGGLEVADAAELLRELVRLLSDPAGARGLGERGRGAIAAVRGGTEKNLDLALSLLQET